jgi:hypothetical protein
LAKGSFYLAVLYFLFDKIFKMIHMVQPIKKCNKLFLALIFFAVSCNKADDVQPLPPATIASVTSPTGTTSGTKNTIITITGTNFITDTSKIKVKVNGNSCIVLSATSTAVTAKIPVGIVELFLDGTRYAGPVFTYIYTYTLSSVTNGQVGLVDGPVATAKIEEIVGITIDAGNNIFTAQYSKPRVRKIDAAGVVSTVAGNGTSGYTDAQGVNAKFIGFDNCAADALGNVYVAEDSRIRKIDAAGNVTTLTTLSATYPAFGIKIGKLGNIYISGNNSIAKYNSSGVLSWRLASHGTGNIDGDTSLAQFSLYGNIEVDDTEKNIYISTILTGQASTIKKLDLTAKTVTTIAGDGTAGNTSGAALSSKFKLITTTCLDKSGGLYIADGFNHRIAYLKDGIVTTITGGTGSGDVDGDASTGKINYPTGLALDNKGQLFIGCYGNNKLKKLSSD